MIFVVGGGSGGTDQLKDEGILYCYGLVREDVGAGTLYSTGGSTSGISLFDTLTISGAQNTIQYGYLRLGPVDLTGVESITAKLGVTVSGNGDTYAAIFLSQSDNDRRWTAPYGTAFEETTNRDLITRNWTLPTALTGQYYVYVGTDSGNESWKNVRTANIVAVKLNKAAS